MTKFAKVLLIATPLLFAGPALAEEDRDKAVSQDDLLNILEGARRGCPFSREAGAHRFTAQRVGKNHS